MGRGEFGKATSSWKDDHQSGQQLPRKQQPNEIPVARASSEEAWASNHTDSQRARYRRKHRAPHKEKSQSLQMSKVCSLRSWVFSGPSSFCLAACSCRSNATTPNCRVNPNRDHLTRELLPPNSNPAAFKWWSGLV